MLLVTDLRIVARDAWESVGDAAVDDRAMELARWVAADPELARVAVGSFREEVVEGA